MKDGEHIFGSAARDENRAEAKAFLLGQREALAEIERRQFANAMAMSPSERLRETLDLCDSAAEFTRAEPTVESYLADAERWRCLAKAWKAKQHA